MLTNEKTMIQKVVLTGLMMGIVMVMTFIIRIPVPATQGYIHLGDSMIFFGVLLLGWKYGAIAAGVGSALADLIGGYGVYAPITLVVKGLMAVVMGLFIKWAITKGITGIRFRVIEGIGMVLAGIIMVLGYYGAESLMYGNWVTPLLAIPMNIIQFSVGVVLAMALAGALYKTPAKKMFAYKLSDIAV